VTFSHCKKGDTFTLQEQSFLLVCHLRIKSEPFLRDLKFKSEHQVRKHHFLSFRRKPESSNFNMFWMPDQVRHDVFGTFYECTKFVTAIRVCHPLSESGRGKRQLPTNSEQGQLQSLRTRVSGLMIKDTGEFHTSGWFRQVVSRGWPIR